MAYVDGSRTVGGKAYRQHKSLRQFILDRDNHTCQLCGKTGNIVDHIIPYAVSYDSTVGNLRALCFRCNVATRRKRKNHSLTLEQYYQWLERELALA